MSSGEDIALLAAMSSSAAGEDGRKLMDHVIKLRNMRMHDHHAAQVIQQKSQSGGLIAEDHVRDVFYLDLAVRVRKRDVPVAA